MLHSYLFPAPSTSRSNGSSHPPSADDQVGSPDHIDRYTGENLRELRGLQSHRKSAKILESRKGALKDHPQYPDPTRYAHAACFPATAFTCECCRCRCPSHLCNCEGRLTVSGPLSGPCRALRALDARGPSGNGGIPKPPIGPTRARRASASRPILALPTPPHPGGFRPQVRSGRWIPPGASLRTCA